jgi:hypothetical protein
LPHFGKVDYLALVYQTLFGSILNNLFRLPNINS